MPTEQNDELGGGTAGSSEAMLLGLSTDQLAGLSIDELTGNKTAITMLVHYYKALLDENRSMRNDLNTAKTYIDGYARNRSNATVGAFLLLGSNVGIGFGVNLLTSNVVWPGLATLLPALLMAAVGTYFALKDR